MHTCAHTPAEPELFGLDPGAPGGDITVMQVTGVLAEPPVIRTRSDHSHPAPVLCLELHQVGPHGNTVHAEVPFAEGQRKAIEAQAHALHAGQRVTVTAPIHRQRLFLPYAQSVTLVAD